MACNYDFFFQRAIHYVTRSFEPCFFYMFFNLDTCITVLFTMNNESIFKKMDEAHLFYVTSTYNTYVTVLTIECF